LYENDPDIIIIIIIIRDVGHNMYNVMTIVLSIQPERKKIEHNEMINFRQTCSEYL